MAKLLIASPEFGCSSEILTIAAMLSGMYVLGLKRASSSFFLIVPTVWFRPPNQRREADAAKAAFTVPDSDHLTLLNVYNNYQQSMLFNLTCFIILLTSEPSRQK